MRSLVLRNLLFTILQPGMVAGLIPYWILRTSSTATFKNSLSPFQYIAIFIFAAGIAILFYCISMFAINGKGTLSPADPTKKLVVSGLYRFSRNPMYIGVLLMLIGEAVFFSSGSLWIYAAIVFIAFNLFIILHEEPRLKRDFGTEYQQYLKTTRRWL
jgi:protein-S-isoprenylcysteine O-methyltransferase Ste14